MSEEGAEEDRLRGALEREIAKMRRSMDWYDRGAVEEGERLATGVATLLRDGRGRVRSLLGQLGIVENLRFPDTRHLASAVGGSLAYAKLAGEKVEFVPILNGRHPRRTINNVPMLPFREWWGQWIFGTKAEPRSRRDLVEAIRNQDGGAHVDAELTEELYRELRNLGVPGLRVVDGELRRTMQIHAKEPRRTFYETAVGAPLAYMRQIAHEVQYALKTSGYWVD
jgi:hypothetical protein